MGKFIKESFDAAIVAMVVLIVYMTIASIPRIIDNHKARQAYEEANRKAYQNFIDEMKKQSSVDFKPKM